MKTISTFAVALGLCVVSAWAQPGPGRHDGAGRPPVMPLIAALDANQDRVLDSSEIAGAGAAITKAFAAVDGKISVALLMPQRPGGTNESRKVQGEQGRRPAPPVIRVLDVNADGSLDTAELTNAGTALLSLDKNGDGQLTPAELHPHRPGMRGGPSRGERPMPRDGGPGEEQAPPVEE